MASELSCTFCKIIKGDPSAVLVYKDDYFLALMDNHPINTGHLLVMPRQHYETLLDMPLNEVGRLFILVARITKAVKNAMKADGIQIGQNNGRAARQVINHVHVHIIPRFFDDSLGGSRPLRKDATLLELRNAAEAIEKEFKDSLNTS